jgi:hypothetical protein
MISPQEFLERWNKDIYGLVHYEEVVIDKSVILNNDKNFLVIAGLPESAAPFLSFEGSEQGGGKPLNEKYEVSENEFKEFIYIGFTGENNPICISTTSGTVVSFDYQNNFDEIFINSSINQLAESLLIYDDFVKKIKLANGRKAFLEKNAPSESILWLEKELKRIDKNSLNESSFWKTEIESYVN